MKKMIIIFALVSSCMGPAVFAGKGDAMKDESCATIAKACEDAGFARDNGGKGFWTDCMKPVLMGKTVKEVKVSADTAKTCRQLKIKEMKQEVKDLQSV